MEDSSLNSKPLRPTASAADILHSRGSNTPEATDSSPNPETAENYDGPRMERTVGNKLFLWLLGGVSLMYAIVLVYHASVPPGTTADEQAFLEQCRQICLKYGLVSTGNVKHDAKAFLTAVDARPLSMELDEILKDTQFAPTESQPHPLLGKKVPGFQLLTYDRNPRQLSKLHEKGPVVLVFYYGFECSHCVAQLYALNDDLAYFNELDSQIVALSADKPEKTAMQFAEYGKFDFTVLSDTDNLLAQQFGCFEPVTETSEGMRQHGTFLIRQDGTMAWAYRGVTPFTDNRSLLVLLAKLRSGSNDEAALVSVK